MISIVNNMAYSANSDTEYQYHNETTLPYLLYDSLPTTTQSTYACHTSLPGNISFQWSSYGMLLSNQASGGTL